MSPAGFFDWLATTQGSIALHESLYMYPVVESIHVWALVLIFGMATTLDLRLLGITLREIPVSEVAGRLLPWTVTGFIIMVITGLLLVYAIPIRTYQSVFFRAKLILLLLAGLNVFLFHNGIYLKVREWDRDPTPPRRARIAGAASLVLWACIIFAGRMIAYNWFDCDRPQGDLVKVLASCPAQPAK
jgi:hypothetical protein